MAITNPQICAAHLWLRMDTRVQLFVLDGSTSFVDALLYSPKAGDFSLSCIRSLLHLFQLLHVICLHFVIPTHLHVHTRQDMDNKTESSQTGTTNANTNNEGVSLQEPLQMVYTNLMTPFTYQSLSFLLIGSNIIARYAG